MTEIDDPTEVKSDARERFERAHVQRRLNHAEDGYRGELGEYASDQQAQIDAKAKLLEGHTEELKQHIQATSANQMFMAAHMKLPVKDVADKWEAYKARAAKHFGINEDASEIDFYNAIKKSVQDKDASKEWITNVLTEARSQGIKGGMGLTVAYARAIEASKEHPGYDASKLGKLQSVFKETFEGAGEKFQGEHKEFKGIFELIAARTGLEGFKEEEAGADDEDLIAFIDRADDDDLMRLAVYLQEQAGDFADDKGGFQRTAEAFGRAFTEEIVGKGRAADRSRLIGSLKEADAGRLFVPVDGQNVLEEFQDVHDRSRYRGDKEFRPATAAETEVIKSDLQQKLHRIAGLKKLTRMATETVDPTAPEGGVEEFFRPAIEMLPFMAQGMVPVAGIGMIAASTYEFRTDEIAERNPNLSPEQVDTLASVSALVEAPAVMFGSRLIFGQLKAFNKMFKPLEGAGTSGFARMLATKDGARRLATRFGAVWAAENVEEAVQDFSPIAISAMAEALDEDYKGFGLGDWMRDYVDTRPDVAMAILPLGMMGAGISTYKDFANGKGLLQWRQGMELVGLSEEAIAKVMDAETPEAGQAAFVEGFKDAKAAIAAGDAEVLARVEAAKFAAYKESEDFQRYNDDPSSPTVKHVETAEGHEVWEVTNPDGEMIGEAGSFKDAIELADWWVKENDPHQATLAAMDAIESFQETGAKIQEDPRPYSLQTMIDEGGITHGEAMQALERAAQNAGESYAGLTPAQAQVFGTNEFTVRKGIAEAISTIYHGASPLVPFEENAEGYFKLAVHRGDFTMEDAIGWKRALEAAEGKTTHGDSEAEVQEWFSQFAVAYLMGERKSETAKKFLPDVVLKFLEVLKEKFAMVLSRAATLLKMKQDGKMKGDFEKHLARSVGLDEDYRSRKAMEGAQAQDQLFADEDAGGKRDLLKEIRKLGKLPTTDPEFQGELDSLKANLGKGKWAANTSKTKGVPLDRLREALGFADINAMLDALREATLEEGQKASKSSFNIEGKAKATDAEYMAAVEAGDVETQQRLVDEAAMEAGYNLSHRNDRDQHPKESGFVILFASDGSNEGYGDNNFLIRRGDLPHIADNPWVAEWYANSSLMQDWAVVNNVSDPEVILRQAEKELNPDDIVDTAMFWDDAEGVGQFWQENESRLLRDKIIGFETYDGAVIFDPHSSNIIKSADPITRDDDGNVIPLSQRFDESKPEITFAMEINRQIQEIERKFKERKISHRVAVDEHKGEEFAPEVKEKVKDLLYEVFPMKEMAAQAITIMDAGIDTATREFYNDTSGLKPAVRGALGAALARYYNDTGSYDMSAGIVERLAELGTEFGQGVKSFDLLGFAFDTPEAVQAFFQRQVNKVNKELKTLPEVEATRNVAEEIIAEANRMLNEWIDEYLAKIGISGSKPANVESLPSITFSLQASLKPLIEPAAKILEESGAAALEDALISKYGDKVKKHLKDIKLEALSSLAAGKGKKGAKADAKEGLTKKAKKSAAEKLRNRGIKSPKQAHAALEKLMGMLDKGEITNADIDMVFAEKFKTPTLTEDISKELAVHAKKIGTAPIGSAERRDRTAAMMDYVYDQFKDIKKSDILWSIWYANILSGHHTHFRNLGDTGLQVVFDTAFTALVQRHPIQAMRFIAQGFKTGLGAKLGAQEAARHVATGGEMLGRETVSKFGKKSVLERKMFSGVMKLFSKLKLVSRLLVAEDGFWFHTAREMKARMVALDMARTELEKGTPAEDVFTAAETLLNNLDEQIADLKERASREWDELDKTDMDADAGKKWQARRVRELRIQERDGDLVERASDFAARATYNYKPEHSIGVLGNMLGTALQQGTPYGVGRLLMPFVRISVNVTNKALDYTPWGVVRGSQSTTFVGTGKGDVTRAGETIKDGDFIMKKADNQAMEIKKGIFGTIGIVALLLKGGDDGEEDGFQVHGSGPSDYNKDKQIRGKGWIPFSIQVGDKYYSFKNTPLSIVFTIVGNFHDAKRYDLYRGEDKGLLTRFAFAMSDASTVVLDQSYLSSLADFFDAMGRHGESKTRALQRLLGRTFDPSAAIPFSNLFKQITRDLDPKLREKNDFLAGLYSMTPITSHWNKPKLDALGMEIGQRPVGWLWSKENKDADNYRIWKMIADKQAFLGNLYGYRHKMEADQYYEFQKARGEQARKMLVASLPAMERMSKENAKKHMRKISTRSTDYAKKVVGYRE